MCLSGCVSVSVSVCAYACVRARAEFADYPGAHWVFPKNMGNMGISATRIWDKYGIFSDFSTKIWDIYGTYIGPTPSQSNICIDYKMKYQI